MIRPNGARTSSTAGTVEAKKALEYEDKDDGAFWMLGCPGSALKSQAARCETASKTLSRRSWKDFIENWSRIGVVDRTVDINTVRLHVKAARA